MAGTGWWVVARDRMRKDFDEEDPEAQPGEPEGA